MEETIPPDQQQGQKDRIGGAGSGPLPLDQQQQTGTVVAEREHAPPDDTGDNGKAEIAGQ